MSIQDSLVRRRRAAALAVLTGLAAGAGCQQPKFGARMARVTLDSTPQGEPAYLIPNEAFLATPPEKRTAAWYQPYYVGDTPKPVRIEPYVWVYVVGRPDGSFSDPRTFNPAEADDGTVRETPAHANAH